MSIRRHFSIACRHCGKVFSLYPSSADRVRYCSGECRKAALALRPSRRRVVHTECAACGKAIAIPPYLYKPGRNYCSRQCTGQGLKQYAGPDHWNRQVQDVTVQCATCGKGFQKREYDMGRFCSHECYAATLVGRSPEEHPNWKGGVTPENKRVRSADRYKTWRVAVFERDNYTCRRCGQHGGYLVAHHLYRFAKWPHLRFTVANGHTLCRACHHATIGHESDYLVSIGLDATQPPLFMLDTA